MKLLNDQKKIGIIIGYLTIIANALVGLLFTPFLIHSLGNTEYGVYKIVASFSGYLNILNFGTGMLISRYIAKFNTTHEQEKKENYLFMMFLITGIIAIGIAIIGFCMYFLIDPIYSKSLNSEQIELAKKLFLILILNFILTIIDNALQGIPAGYEKFIYTKSLSLSKVIFRTIAMLVLLLFGQKSLAIVIADFTVAFIIFIANFLYSFVHLKEKVKYHYFDKVAFKESMSFSVANVLQAFVNQVNQSLDTVILGAIMAPEYVAIYSVALVLFSMFSSFSTVISSVYVPHVTKMIYSGASNEDLTDLCVKVGRVQFVLSGGIAFGFLILGKCFITVWMGKGYIDAYYCALLLLFPVVIHFAQSICVSVLEAKMKKLFRSCVLCGTALLNIILTIIFIKLIGMIGAALATGVSVIIGYIIIMNIYYHKVIGINVPVFFKKLFKGILPALILTAVICIPIYLFMPYSWAWLIAGGIGFCVVLGVCLCTFGFNKQEKHSLKNYVDKALKLVKIKK